METLAQLINTLSITSSGISGEAPSCLVDWVSITNLVCNTATVIGLAWLAGRAGGVKIPAEGMRPPS